MQTLNNVPAGDAGYALASVWSGGRVVGQWDLWDVQKDIEGSMLLTSHHVCIVSIQLYVLYIFKSYWIYIYTYIYIIMPIMNMYMIVYDIHWMIVGISYNALSYSLHIDT